MPPPDAWRRASSSNSRSSASSSSPTRPSCVCAVWQSSSSASSAVPVAVIGTDTLAPAGKIVGRWTRPTIIFGEPIDLSPWAGREESREAQRELTDLVMERIAALSGQEYVADTYCADARRALRDSREG